MAYDQLFETINRNKLTNQASVDKAILQELSLSKVIGLAKNLYQSIEAESSAPKVLSLQDYHFLANSRMSGMFGTACSTHRCRSQRADRLARFATLYSDAVYIQNYFIDFQHRHTHPPTNPFQEWALRDSVSGSINIINQTKPLLRSGIVRFVPTTVPLCPNCDAPLIEQINSFRANMDGQIKKLDKLYSKSASANLLVIPTPSADGPKYRIQITCDEDLFEHGGGWIETSQLPPTLLRKLAHKQRTSECKLSSSEILKAHLLTALILGIATDVSCLRFYCSNSNLKYLTDRNTDISILQAATEEHNFLKYDNILSSQLIFELPFFSNISLPSLLKIRQNEYDAFSSYRETISHLISEYIAHGHQLSPDMANQIYSDVIQPKVSKLDRRISSIRKSALLKSIAQVVVSTSSLFFGLYGNYMPPPLQTTLISLGVGSAVSTAKSLSNIIGTPTEIKNHNLYFVWKLSKKSKVI
jgi:hypothetical protein